MACQLIRPDDDFAVGDSGYAGLGNRDDIKNTPVLFEKEYRIVKRPSFWKKKELCELADEFDRNDERRLISKRQSQCQPLHARHSGAYP
jgi:hypothetical protein